MNDIFKNLKVLITRPVHQAKPLCESIEQLGGNCYLLPTMEIVPLDNEKLRQQVERITNNDIVIYISANAAHCSETLWPAKKPAVQIIAIGPGTAKALTDYHWQVNYVPAIYSSEGLLQLDILQRIAGKTIFIFCGENSKPYLAKQLTQRGAQVQMINCYQRHLMHIDRSVLENLQQEKLSAVVSTSLENLENFIDHVRKFGQHWLLALSWIVVNQDMQKSAEKAGVQRVILAANASDAAIIEALKLLTSEARA